MWELVPRQLFAQLALHKQLSDAKDKANASNGFIDQMPGW